MDGNDEDDIITTMTLESNDKAQLQSAQSLLDEMSPLSETEDSSQCKSLDGSIRFLEPNSTSTIGGKMFNVSTTECTYSSEGSRTRTVEALKTYKHESPERAYWLTTRIKRFIEHRSRFSPEYDRYQEICSNYRFCHSDVKDRVKQNLFSPSGSILQREHYYINWGAKSERDKESI